MPENVLEPISKVLMSGYVGQGPAVEAFERALVPWFGNENVLSVNSGTSALTLALRLANVGFGDEVISTAMTCTATNVPILAMGAKIVWADIDPMTGNIDPLDVERKITERTKAIMAVHWGGYPCDLDGLNRVGRKYGIRIIEDAAHAFGATYHGRPVGSHSDFVCFSFQAIKHLTTVDGGALVCRDTESYKRGKLLRWYGIDRDSERKDFRCEEDVLEYGYKFHMNDVNATIGLEQLAHVGEVLRRHRENATYYRDRFQELPGVKLLDYRTDREGSYWLFTIRVPGRRTFMQAMKNAGITVSQVHARNDHHTMFKEFRRILPGVDQFIAEQVSIPVGWWLTEEQREFVADCVVRLCQ
ncbi:MAG: DegT/DnrJ/EryC1/StrS family aminotransferase [Armatimonadetes bacterium]|nr:DegT/DnrJ/EryC1/StrS family aminotransferase [Armatimonadota bacterium]